MRVSIAAAMIKYANLPPALPPLLAVVVDTEEEFDWGRPLDRSEVGVTSIPCQERMQEIFSRYGIIPTYVMDYPAATTPLSRDYLRRLHKDGLCEIGAHLHPWVNPPYEEEVCNRNSFPGNLPPDLERRKLAALTQAIQENFGIRPRIYKAGRYGIGPSTMEILEELGFEIDLSVAPHTSFRASEGPDFRSHADRPWLAGASQRILEIPLSIGFAGPLAPVGPTMFRLIDQPLGRRLHLPGLLARTRLLERICLTPEHVDLSAQMRLTRSLLKQGKRVFSFCYHSPSLAVGHTPYVRSEEQLRDFLSTCDAYFRFFSEEIGGQFISMSKLQRALAPAARSSHPGLEPPPYLDIRT